LIDRVGEVTNIIIMQDFTTIAYNPHAEQCSGLMSSTLHKRSSNSQCMFASSNRSTLIAW